MKEAADDHSEGRARDSVRFIGMFAQMAGLAILWVTGFLFFEMIVGTSSLAAGPDTWQPMAHAIAVYFFPITYVIASWHIIRRWKST
jgi:hypothetical protein